MKRKKETTLIEGNTGSLSKDTTFCTNSSRGVAQYVYDTLKNSQDVSLSITITRQEKSEDFFATTATTVSSEGIQTQTFYDGWLTT